MSASGESLLGKGSISGFSNGYASLRRSSDPVGIAEAYYQAARALIQASAQNRTNPNLAGMPILYLVRHWVELELKVILDVARRCGDRVPDHPRDHGLGQLWNKVRKYVENRWPEEWLEE